MLSLQTSRSFGMVSRHAPMLSFPGRNTSCVVTSLGLISPTVWFSSFQKWLESKNSHTYPNPSLRIHQNAAILGRFSVSRFHVATMKIVWSMWKTAQKNLSTVEETNGYLQISLYPHLAVTITIQWLHGREIQKGSWADFSIRPTLVHMPTKLRESHQRKVEMIPLWILSTSKTPDLEHWKLLKWYGNDTFKNCQIQKLRKKNFNKKKERKETNKIPAKL